MIGVMRDISGRSRVIFSYLFFHAPGLKPSPLGEKL